MLASRWSRRLIGCGALALALAGAVRLVARQGAPAADQPRGSQAQANQPPPPVFHTEANYVRVDAYPTRNDAPVPDLTAGDFEVLENGVPQRIEQFERVVIRGGGPQDARIEPNTVAESRAMVESSRARVFVLFLDVYHVEVEASRNIRDPLVKALNKLIGPDDLVAVMTPEMSPNDMTFARKTTTIEGILSRYWHWGERERIMKTDPEDEQYVMCYPNRPPQDPCADQNGIAQAMIDRRHEKRTIDALQDLVRYLRGVREERKAILAISDGWRLFRPDSSLARVLNCDAVPGVAPIQIDPRTGRLATHDTVQPGGGTQAQCSRDRLLLSEIEDDREFREMLDEANRANASFYPIDPRGLVAFDEPMMRLGVDGPPPPMTPLAVDNARLAARLTSLRTLAEATDGLAIVNTNDLTGGLARVVNDLSSYYLLGYYSTGKLDGKFHAITVRVKRPGIRVRARRGYLAATPAAMTTAANAAAPSAPGKTDAEAHAVEEVLTPLNSSSRDVPIKLRTAAGWRPGGVPAIWMVGELGAGEDWKGGAEADVMVTSTKGATIATGHATVPSGARSFRAALRSTEPLTPGDYVLRVRARSTTSNAAVTESVSTMLATAPGATGTLLVRRGPLTGNRDMPTADVRFRRNEQLRVEMPSPDGNGFTARLLDRTGKPLAIPLATTTREDEDGARWVTTQVALAPLAVGDYVIELSTPSDSGTRMLVAFRIVP